MSGKQGFKCLLLGYGHIGKRHAAVIAEHPETELSGIADLTDVRSVAGYPSDIPWYPSWKDALANSGGHDLVIIALPNGEHIPAALAALKSGYHLLIEKPMGLTALSCQQVLELAEQQKKQVFVVKQNRYSPQVQWLKDLVDSGKMGKIHMIQVNCFWNRDDRYYLQQGHPWRGKLTSDGGVLFTQFSHFIDILYWIFGPLTVESAHMENLAHSTTTEFPDSGSFRFRTAGQALGFMQFSTAVWNRNLESSITILGDSGTIQLGGQYMDTVLHCHIPDYILPQIPSANPPNLYGNYSGSAANHVQVLEQVVMALKGEKSAATNGQEGMEVVRIIETVHRLANHPI